MRKVGWLVCLLLGSAYGGAIVHPDRLEQQENGLNGLGGSTSVTARWPTLESAWDRRRNTEAEFTAYSLTGPDKVESYIFGYDNARDSSGNEHFRYEERFPNGTVIGEYGFTDYLNSVLIKISYTADQHGFRPIVKIRRIDDGKE